jgi:hypothetical protein
MRWLDADRISRNGTQAEPPLDVRIQQSRDTEKVRVTSDESESPFNVLPASIGSNPSLSSVLMLR